VTLARFDRALETGLIEPLEGMLEFPTVGPATVEPVEGGNELAPTVVLTF
jgi:hypothetical protein